MMRYLVATCLILLVTLATPASAAPPGWDPLPPPEVRNKYWSCGAVLTAPDGLSWARACVVVNDNSHAQAWAVLGNNREPGVPLRVQEASVNLHDELNGPVISHSACGPWEIPGHSYLGCANPTVRPDCGNHVYAKVSIRSGIWVNPPPASRFVPCLN
jgi:hypothetical protein